jgi:hypothetical protein
MNERPAGAMNADRVRAAVRLSNEYFLRSVRMLSELSNGELLTAIVHRAISAGNVGYLDQSPEGDHYASLDSVPPDALRRPVSILAVAGTLGLPYETTRRHVHKLLKSGQCRKVKGGVIAPAAAFVGERYNEAMFADVANLRRLFRALKKAGVELD